MDVKGCFFERRESNKIKQTNKLNPSFSKVVTATKDFTKR